MFRGETVLQVQWGHLQFLNNAREAMNGFVSVCMCVGVCVGVSLEQTNTRLEEDTESKELEVFITVY